MPSRSSVMSAPGLGVWKWADLEIDDCCPFWGCPCGMHFQEASQMGLQHALRHAVRFLELGLPRRISVAMSLLPRKGA